ncbi:MAG: hypothetical protein R3C29_06150 [Dehalococcoidia bacterium]|nr:hypothetical protein [Dehalococcoidia bacterium]
MTLYHFSEEPGIEAFVPRTPVHRTDVEPLVWAIDDWHAPMYYFPRDCPRILVWPLPETTGGDMERWFGTTPARILAFMEYAWLERMSSTPIYRYEMPYEGFFSLDDAGMFVSRETITPVSVEPVGDLVAALRSAKVELRLSETLTHLRGLWNTTFHASGIRLRNAQGWDYVQTPAPEPIRRKGS